MNMKGMMRVVMTLLALTESVTCLRCDESRVSGEPESVVFNCSSRNIIHLPVVVPMRVTQLQLDHNAIVVVPEAAFQNMQHLLLLDLSFNKIKTLYRNCFFGLWQLRELNLHGNYLNLARLSNESFQGLPSLQVLAIAGQNTVGQYPVDILDNLRQLQTLSVQGNDTELPEDYGRLQKLTTLVLNGCDIRTVSNRTFSAIKISNIATLMIRSCGVESIEPGTFSDFTNLRVLDLSCNSKLNFRRSIQSLGQTVNSSIDTVLLDKTDPGSYGVLDFRDFCSKSHFWESVRRLSLRDVQTNFIVVSDVLCLAGIEELFISHNSIHGATPTQYKLLQIFSQLNKLRVFDLSNTNHPNLPSSYCSCGSDLRFDIDNCLPSYPKLPSISVDKTAQTLPHLTTCPGETYFPLPPRLRYLDMSHITVSGRNTLDSNRMFTDNDVRFWNLSGTAYVRHLLGFPCGMTKLQVFDFSHGRLESFGENALRYYPSLRVLNLSHNALGKGSTPYMKVFTFSRRLEVIDLSNNGIRRIHPNTFSTCTTLQEIKLANNQFDNVHLHVERLTSLHLIDLSGNLLPFLSSVFTQELDNLNKQTVFQLNLKSNEFLCDCSGLTFIHWLLTTDIHVTDRTNLTCVYRGAHTRISAISLSGLQNECETYLSLYGALSLIVAIVVMGVVAMYLFREFIRFKIYIWRNHRAFATSNLPLPLRRYQVTVLFDEYDTELRDWALTELNGKLLEWQFEAYFMIRDEYEPGGIQCGSPLEKIAVAMKQSEKLIVCVTEELLRESEFRQQLRFARYSNKRKEDYMFISRGYVPLPEIVSCRMRPWQREKPSFRLDLHEHDADTYWGIVHNFLTERSRNGQGQIS